MVCQDTQIRRLYRFMQKEKSLAKAACKAGIDVKTARKYKKLQKLPSEVKAERHWRTRHDGFADVWPEVTSFLSTNPGFEAKTLFEHMQRTYPGRFADGQLRTFQRRVKQWRAQEGPGKEVYFTQEHNPGELCQSDFSHLNDLQITIAGQHFKHMIYHFVLTWSNWETGTVCFSESFESLSEGLQNALWELGSIPKAHQIDRMSAAVPNNSESDEFTIRYQAILAHYKLTGKRINAGQPNENGDIEQRHYRFKRALNQALLLRGSRDFVDQESYEAFLRQLFKQLNRNRQDKLAEELKIMRSLPAGRLESCKRLRVKVNQASLVRINYNNYSVHSRLIGEYVNIRLYANYLEVWYGQKCIESMPRLHGRSKHHVQYRHIIDWLVRKPGAFMNYRYKQDLFPSHRFRIAYDRLCENIPSRASKEYLRILHLAAKERETLVDAALAELMAANKKISYGVVKSMVADSQSLVTHKDVHIDAVKINAYDGLLPRHAGPTEAVL